MEPWKRWYCPFFYSTPSTGAAPGTCATLRRPSISAKTSFLEKPRRAGVMGWMVATLQLSSCSVLLQLFWFDWIHTPQPFEMNELFAHHICYSIWLISDNRVHSEQLYKWYVTQTALSLHYRIYIILACTFSSRAILLKLAIWQELFQKSLWYQEEFQCWISPHKSIMRRHDWDNPIVSNANRWPVRLTSVVSFRLRIEFKSVNEYE